MHRMQPLCSAHGTFHFTIIILSIVITIHACIQVMGTGVVQNNPAIRSQLQFLFTFGEITKPSYSNAIKYSINQYRQLYGYSLWIKNNIKLLQFHVVDEFPWPQQLDYQFAFAYNSQPQTQTIYKQKVDSVLR